MQGRHIITRFIYLFIAALIAMLLPTVALAAESSMDLTGYWAGTVSLAIFVFAYMLGYRRGNHSPAKIKAGHRGRRPDMGVGSHRLWRPW